MKNKSDVKRVRIGDIEFKFPYADLLPEMEEKEFKKFCERIGEEGIQVPVVLDEKFNVIDGGHRIKAAKLNKIKSVPADMRPGLTEQQKLEMVMDLNLHRRHLTRNQRKELILKFRSQQMSLRQIAEKLNISHTTVKRCLDSTVTSATVDEVIGKDNKRRSAKVKNKKRIPCSSIKDLHRAAEGCDKAGFENLPNNVISIKRLERKVREIENKRKRDKKQKDFELGSYKLLAGDFRERAKEIEDNSVGMIFTDPPYGKEYLGIWDELAKFAVRKLKPGKLLVTYSGTLYLPQIFDKLCRHLEYIWCASIYHSGRKNRVNAVNIIQAYKPILIFQKPPRNIYWRAFTDMVTGGQSKDHHIWEQSVSEAEHYISALCNPEDLLVDCMMGSGTTIAAAARAGIKRSIGIDSDMAAFAEAKERINKILTEKPENNLAS